MPIATAAYNIGFVILVRTSAVWRAEGQVSSYDPIFGDFLRFHSSLDTLLPLFRHKLWKVHQYQSMTHQVLSPQNPLK
jgi:hypothetical protein